jgi:hypothetical protein
VRPQGLGLGERFGRIRDAVLVADAETQRMVLWNPVATKMFGYSTSKVLKLRIVKLSSSP